MTQNKTLNNTIRLSVISLSIGVLFACGQSQKPASPASTAPASAAAAPAAAPSSAVDATKDAAKESITTATKTEQVSSSTTSYTDSQRKFIRTANANFAVKDVYQSANAIEDAVSAHGGFVTQNDIEAHPVKNEHYAKGDGKIINISEYELKGTLTVRIPSERTQEFLRAIASQIEFLDSRTFAAHDAQFEILKQQLDATRLNQTQNEQGQLTQEKGNIEQKSNVIDARSETKSQRDDARIAQKQFDDKVAFSTITLAIYQPNVVKKSESDDLDSIVLDNRPSFFKRLGQSFAIGWYAVLEIVVQLMKIWPLWLAGLLAYFAISKFKLKKFWKPAEKKTNQTEGHAEKQD